MNAPHSPSLLAQVPLAPADPILGITEAFLADTNPRKVNLGVGVYTDDAGKVPLLECVRRAEAERLKAAPPRNYLPIDGLAVYDRAVQELVFGRDAPALKEKRVVTVQALGGTGGLKIGADFLKRLSPNAEVWISDPSWENHRQLFEAAGFIVRSYAYYEPKTRGLDFAGMRNALAAAPAGTIVVLHTCCHNRPASISSAANGPKSSPSCSGAASFRSSTSPTRASPTAWTRTPTRRGFSPAP